MGALPVIEKVNIARRLMEEGKPFPITFNNANIYFGTGNITKNISGGFVVYPGHEYIPLKGHLAASRTPLAMSLNIGTASPTGLYPDQVFGLNSISHDRLAPVTEGSSVNAVVQRFDITDDSATPFNVAGGNTGIMIAKGWDKSSNYQIMEIGDSIRENSAFTSGGDALLSGGAIVSHYTSATVRPRMINKAKGGINSTNMVALLRAVKYDVTEHINIHRLMIGTNDVLQAWAISSGLTSGQITTLIATCIANIAEFVNYKRLKYGDTTPLIVYGPTPLSNTVQEAAMKQLREAIRDYIVSIGGAAWYGEATETTPITPPANNIWFMSYGAIGSYPGVFMATDTNKYIETVGNRVHPNDQAHLLMKAKDINMLTVNNIK